MARTGGGMSYARRVDANHADIATALREGGAVVVDTSHFGQGIPDLWVTSHAFTGWLEIKDGSKPPSARKLTPAEEKFFATVNRGRETHAHIVLSVPEAMRLVFGFKVTV